MGCRRSANKSRLEAAVMSTQLDWGELIATSETVPDPVGPKNIIKVLSSLNNPFVLEGDSQRQALSEAYQLDLGAIYSYRHSRQPLTANDKAIWVDRLAWLLHELKACKQQKPDLPKLAAILSVSRAFLFDKPIWERIPVAFLSDNLFASMAALIGTTHSEFSSGGKAEPIWEREAVDAFVQADKDADWPTIESLWRTVASSVYPDHYLAEATTCLCTTNKGEYALGLAVDQFGSILLIICVAGAMTSHQIGRIGRTLKSNRGRFALVQSLAFNHPRNETLSEETLEALAALFKDVQQDAGEWRKWMRALNRYPVRTEVLQAALGYSLNGASIEAKSACIEAIELNASHGECREATTDCIAAFARVADLEERKQLWSLVYQHWMDWNFDAPKQDNHLTWMAVSELDYGVIGYIVENLTASEREEALQKATNEMNVVANAWHADITARNTAWYRALAKWQILQFAQQVANGNADWELPTHVFLPFDPAKDRYFSMTYPTDMQQRWGR